MVDKLGKKKQLYLFDSLISHSNGRSRPMKGSFFFEKKWNSKNDAAQQVKPPAPTNGATERTWWIDGSRGNVLNNRRLFFLDFFLFFFDRAYRILLRIGNRKGKSNQVKKNKTKQKREEKRRKGNPSPDTSGDVIDAYANEQRKRTHRPER